MNKVASNKKFKSQVDSVLKGMRTTDMKKKGTNGEEAVYMLLEKMYQRHGGILIHSYIYPTEKGKEGNIKRDDSGKLYCENLGGSTEIDVLYVTPYRVFPIEIKSYSSKKITLTDEGIKGVAHGNKSPIHQNEMHCRHLYPQIFTALPLKQSKYIIPIVVFVDRCKLVDERSQWQKDYILKAILNNVMSTVIKNNTPLEYSINLNLMDSVLKRVMINCEKYLPARYV